MAALLENSYYRGGVAESREDPATVGLDAGSQDTISSHALSSTGRSSSDPLDITNTNTNSNSINGISNHYFCGEKRNSVQQQDAIIQELLKNRPATTDEYEMERQRRMYNMLRHSSHYKRLQVKIANTAWTEDDDDQSHQSQTNLPTGLLDLDDLDEANNPTIAAASTLNFFGNHTASASSGNICSPEECSKFSTVTSLPPSPPLEEEFPASKQSNSSANFHNIPRNNIYGVVAGSQKRLSIGPIDHSLYSPSPSSRLLSSQLSSRSNLNSTYDLPNRKKAGNKNKVTFSTKDTTIQAPAKPKFISRFHSDSNNKVASHTFQSNTPPTPNADPSPDHHVDHVTLGNRISQISKVIDKIKRKFLTTAS